MWAFFLFFFFLSQYFQCFQSAPFGSLKHGMCSNELTLNHGSYIYDPCLNLHQYLGHVQYEQNHNRRNCLLQAISPFPSVFSTHLDTFLPFSSNLKLSSANSLNFEQSKICRLGKGEITQDKTFIPKP